MENKDVINNEKTDPCFKKGVLYMVASALGFSIIPILATLGLSADIAPGILLFYRFFIAACLFFIYCLIKQKSLLFQGRKNVTYLIIAGTIYSAQCILFFSAFKYISAAVGEVIFYIYPVFVAILSAIFLKEKITKYKVLGILAAVTGIGVVLYAPGGGIQISGVLLVILSALASSCYFTFNKKFTAEISTPVIMTYVCFTCSIIYLIYSICLREFTIPNQWTLWLYIALLAIWSTVIGLLCLMKGLKILEAGMASLVSLCEPIFTILLSYIVLGTALTPVQLFGSSIVIAAIYIYEKK